MELLGDLFKYIPDPVLVTSPEKGILFASRAWYALSGGIETEVLGRRLEQAPGLMEESREVLIRKREAWKQGDFSPFIIAFEHDAHSSLRYIEVNAAPARLTGEEAFVLVLRDVTERQREKEELHRSRETVERLYGVVRGLDACDQEEEVYRTAVEAAELLIPFSMASISIVEDGNLEQKTMSTELEMEDRCDCPLHKRLCQKTYEMGRTFAYGDIREEEDAALPWEGMKAVISIPAGSFGVFQVVSPMKGAFDEHDQRLVELLVGHAVEALKRIRLRNELRRQAIRDPLTGLYNRRYFDQAIQKEFQRSERYHHPIGFLMVDVDRFKEINDRFGHHRGDRVLQEVARLLKETVRTFDFVVRFGGDEFLIVLLEPGFGTEAVIERIRVSLEKSERINRLLEFPLTLSVGGAAWMPEADESLEDVLARADQNMYADKKSKNGRSNGSE